MFKKFSAWFACLMVISISPIFSLVALAVGLENPLGSINTPTNLIGKVIFAVLGLTGVIALVMFIWGGLQWMTAAGNPEKVTKGRDTLMWAVLGLVIIFSSYAILSAVLNVLK
jgi:hypothetical protein